MGGVKYIMYGFNLFSLENDRQKRSLYEGFHAIQWMFT